MSDQAEPREHTNRLINSTSPYLLQHAHNPVDWHPWGPEALEEARKLERPILLSIGYSACHWCHVMERESFEDETIAALMNENFISIKVDREERPDLDEIYMAATVAMNQGQGGWPMTVFLTPELEPIFAGTYFPPQDMHGRPGFPAVLTQVARAWREDRHNLKERAREFVERLRQQRGTRTPLAVGEPELRVALEEFASAFDPTYGGFGPAPKFPPATGLSLLLRLYRRLEEPHALQMVQATLDGMANGGIYDHIGGGFARYSTDGRWLVPHFEKMLYDNALLARTYLEGYQASGDEFFARVATETLDYVLRDMTSPEGGFYSSTDADSEGEEGKFFVWTPEQIAKILDEEEARRFCAYYDITPAGNWEGVSIPNTPRPPHVVAQSLGISGEELQETIQSTRQKVLAARAKRVRPELDDKILTAWNGLMISAFAEGHRILGESRYLEAGERAAEFVLSTLAKPDGRLLRTYRAGVAHLNAYLEDYAYLSEGLVDLYEAGGEARWLREGERLLERTIADFADEQSGAFFNTARDHEKLLMRYKDGTDGATPAGNAVAASALARISYHLDRKDLREAAIRAIKAYGRTIERFPRGFAKSLSVVDFLLEAPLELALVGRKGSPDLGALQRVVGGRYLPNRIQATFDPDARDAAAAGLPLLEGKTLIDGAAALYVCRDFACEAPVTDPSQAEDLLMSHKKEDLEAGETVAARQPGRATSEGTSRYASRFPELQYRTLGSTALTTSILGFGAYRVDDATPEHREALSKALSSGVNLIDTSTNYTDGASERLISSVLRALIDSGEVARDEVIVVSKIGYVQGRNYRLSQEREARGKPYPEMLKIEEGMWHCIHPEFLGDQLSRSLDRLELETLDICLLHNPEYFLSEAARRGAPLNAARDEFYRRLRAAFEFLESQVAEGRIGSYGLSSNAAASPASGPDAPSLNRTLEAARAAGGESHHFRVLQLPVNLFESGAVFERNSGPDDKKTVLEIAAQESIAVLANRPLNAFTHGTLYRLADVAVDSSQGALDEQLGKLEELEVAFRERIAPQIKSAGESLDPAGFFSLAGRLDEMGRAVQGLAHWSQLEAHVHQAVYGISEALNQQLVGETAKRWKTWRDSYFPVLEDSLRELRRQASEKTRARNDALSKLIDPLVPEARRGEDLSRKALWIVASTPGVTCTLTGMRTPAYVEDALGVMGWPALEEVDRVYSAVKAEG
ncbi:MAG: aldo/keto reductase [Gemmatimonadota bacterium]